MCVESGWLVLLLQLLVLLLLYLLLLLLLLMLMLLLVLLLLLLQGGVLLENTSPGCVSRQSGKLTLGHGNCTSTTLLYVLHPLRNVQQIWIHVQVRTIQHVLCDGYPGKESCTGRKNP